MLAASMPLAPATERGRTSSARSKARRFAFRPSALEALEARIQLDGSSILLGHSPNQLEFDGPLSVSYHADQHYNTYTANAGQVVNVKIAATDFPLIQLQGTTSFDVYDAGFEPAGYLPSFAIGSDALLSVYKDRTVQSTETVWSGGAVTFGVDQLFATGGVALPTQNPNHFEIEGSLFTPTSLQVIYAGGASPGPQTHLLGIAGFNGTNLNPTITTPNYVQIGPDVTESIRDRSACRPRGLSRSRGSRSTRSALTWCIPRGPTSGRSGAGSRSGPRAMTTRPPTVTSSSSA